MRRVTNITRLNTMLLLVALLSVSSLNAQQGATVLEQLHELNQYWADHQVEAPVLEKVISFESDRPLIALHLQLVEKHLRNNPPAELTATQLTNRNEGLDILKEYWQTGVFPINTHHYYTLPYFIDDFNTACAVGHIMRESGEVALTERIATENNYAYIRDLQYPEIGEWANANGFTGAELKWIQPTYGPNVTTTYTTLEPNCGNTNGGIDVTVSGITESIEGYEWREGVDLSAPIIATTEDLADAASGFYSLNLPGTGWLDGDYLGRYSLSDVEGPVLGANVVNQPCAGDGSMGSITLNIANPDFYEIKWYNYYANELIAEDVTSINVQGSPEFFINAGPPPYTHRVEVTDVNGCKTLEQFYVGVTSSSPYLSTWQTAVTPASCANNGSIELGPVYGNDYGTAGYTVEWSNGATSETLEDLNPGDYTVVITNDVGCTRTETFTIEDACTNGVDCLDLADVNFGFCAAFLGTALIDGICVGVSGCSTTGTDGVDYADFFFDDINVCLEACGGTTCPPLPPACLPPVQPIQYDITAGEQFIFSAEENLYPLCLEPLIGTYGESVNSVVVTSLPSNGSGGLQGGGDIGYTPDAGFVGTDQITYRVCYAYTDPVVDVCFIESFLDMCVFQTVYFNVTEGGTGDCIDPSLIDPNAACIAVYDPVCGCDGVTYGNSCEATVWGGVTSYTSGECGSVTPATCEYDDPLTDLPWLDNMLTTISMFGAPDCGGTEYVIHVNYGGIDAFYVTATASSIAADNQHVMYDCEGNVLCSEFGFFPDPCAPFTIIDTLWSCSGGVLGTDMMEMDLSLKVFLEGPMNANGTMNPNLSENELLAEHPYEGEPYYYEGPALSGIVPANAVDYILIELREDFGMPAAAQQVAFVLDNGDIVLEDGSFPQFLVDGSQTYQVWLRHHNHLDIVSTSEITPDNMVENWFLNDADTMGPEQLKEVSGIHCMYAGDLNGDGVINVTDYDSWYLSPAVINQYMPQDANLDGVIQATDYDTWFENKAKIGYAQQMD